MLCVVPLLCCLTTDTTFSLSVKAGFLKLKKHIVTLNHQSLLDSVFKFWHFFSFSLVVDLYKSLKITYSINFTALSPYNLKLKDIILELVFICCVDTSELRCQPLIWPTSNLCHWSLKNDLQRSMSYPILILP